MKICYIDESGDLGKLPSPPGQNDQPVLVLGGLFIDVASLEDLTNRFLHLKKSSIHNSHVSQIIILTSLRLKLKEPI